MFLFYGIGGKCAGVPDGSDYRRPVTQASPGASLLRCRSLRDRREIRGKVGLWAFGILPLSGKFVMLHFYPTTAKLKERVLEVYKLLQKLRRLKALVAFVEEVNRKNI